MVSLKNNQPNRLPLGNEEVAALLDEIAERLDAQGANSFRVRAYRNAAQTLRQLRREVHEVLHLEGPAGLERLSGIGRSLSHTIEHFTRSGRSPLLDRLRGEHAPERVLATVPTIGRGMAGRIYEQLHVETLAQLEVAAYDGRLGQVPGIGPKRLRAVRESLAGRFRRPPKIPESTSARLFVEQPPLAELFDIDRRYRRLASLDRLPRIAPRRFNPTGEAWLPILHTQRSERHYTALFSNTARAHELGTTKDWVVIYRDDRGGQWTVITAGYGKLLGRRIVRGREAECEKFYAEEDRRSNSARTIQQRRVNGRETTARGSLP